MSLVFNHDFGYLITYAIKFITLLVMFIFLTTKKNKQKNMAKIFPILNSDKELGYSDKELGYSDKELGYSDKDNYDQYIPLNLKKNDYKIKIE